MIDPTGGMPPGEYGFRDSQDQFNPVPAWAENVIMNSGERSQEVISSALQPNIIGVANGVVPLDEKRRIPSEFLPPYGSTFAVPDVDLIQTIEMPLSVGMPGFTLSPGNSPLYFEFSAPITGFINGHISVSNNATATSYFTVFVQRKNRAGEWAAISGYSHREFNLERFGLEDIPALQGDLFRVCLSAETGNPGTATPYSAVTICPPKFIEDNMPSGLIVPDIDNGEEITTPISAGQPPSPLSGYTWTFFEFTVPTTGFLGGYYEFSTGILQNAQMQIQRSNSAGEWFTVAISGYYKRGNALHRKAIPYLHVKQGDNIRIGFYPEISGGMSILFTPSSKIYVFPPKSAGEGVGFAIPDSDLMQEITTPISEGQPILPYSPLPGRYSHEFEAPITGFLNGFFKADNGNGFGVLEVFVDRQTSNGEWSPIFAFERLRDSYTRFFAVGLPDIPVLQGDIIRLSYNFVGTVSPAPYLFTPLSRVTICPPRIGDNSLPMASLTQPGIVQLSNTINNDETKAATPAGVKTVYDQLSQSSVQKTGDTMSGDLVFDTEVAPSPGSSPGIYFNFLTLSSAIRQALIGRGGVGLRLNAFNENDNANLRYLRINAPDQSSQAIHLGVTDSVLGTKEYALWGEHNLPSPMRQASLPAGSTNILDILGQPSGYYIMQSGSISGLPVTGNFTFGVLWLKGDSIPIGGLLICANLDSSVNAVFQAKVSSGNIGPWVTILTSAINLGSDYSTTESPVMILENGVNRQMKDDDGFNVFERVFKGFITAAADAHSNVELFRGSITKLLSFSGWFRDGQMMAGGTFTRYNLGYDYSGSEWLAFSKIYGDVRFYDAGFFGPIPENRGPRIQLITKSPYARSGMGAESEYWVHVRYSRQ